VSTRIYVEGGGDWSSTKSACRYAFHEFFRKIAPPGHQPKVIASGGRANAFSDFRQALRDHPDKLVVLLVDSEGPVTPGMSSWAHLQQRDGWVRPSIGGDAQAQLMVQCMEAWFLADLDVLQGYYGTGFLAASLPRGPIERVINVVGALEHASHGTQKGQYHKTSHGFDLLALIDPARVRASSAHANQLCVLLELDH